MNEIQRQEYLDAMGIQSYFPKYVLANAKPSRQCQWPEEPSTLEKINPEEKRSIGENISAWEELSAAAGSPTQSISRGQKLRSLLQEKEHSATSHQHVAVSEASGKDQNIIPPDEENLKRDGQNLPPTSSSGEKSIAKGTGTADTVEQSTEVKFSAVLIRINDDLLVINELPYVNKNAFSEPCENLLQAILAALSISLVESEIVLEFFQWPLDDDGDLHSDEKNASRAFHGFVRSRILQKPTKFALVFSEQISRYLFARDDLSEVENGKLLELMDKGSQDWVTQVLVTRSLNAMLSVPGLKKNVWDDLQALRKALIQTGTHP